MCDEDMLSILNCAEIDELAGAFALDALPANESAALLDHLANCPDAHQLVGELSEVAGLLPYLVDEVEPPARLRGNLIAAALLSDGLLSPPSTANPMTQSDSRTLLRVLAREEEHTSPTPLRRQGRWLAPALMAAAAMLVVALGLGIWNVNLQHQLDDRSGSGDRQAVLTALASGARVTPLVSANGVQAQLVRPANGGTAYVVGTLPAPPPGKAYQAWLIRDGQPVDAGVFKPSGFAILAVHGDLNGAQLLAFTLEPEHGSRAPTQPAVAQAALS